MTGASPDEAARQLAAILAQVEASDDPQLALARLLVRRAEATDAEFADAIRYCAIPRRLDVQVVAWLRGDDDPEASARVLARLQDVGLLLHRSDGGHCYHDNVRDALIEDWRAPERRERFAELSERLARHYDALRDAASEVERAWSDAAGVIRSASEARFLQLHAMIESLALAPLLEALYHRALYSLEAGLTMFLATVERYERQGRFTLCDALVGAARDFLTRPAEGDEPGGAEPWLRYWRARLDLSTGRIQKAESTLVSLVSELERAAAPARTGEGNLDLQRLALDDLARLLASTDRYAQALVLYRRKLELLRAEGAESVDAPLTHHHLGALHWTLQDHRSAAAAFQAAVAAADGAGHEAESALGRLALSGVLAETGDLDEAWEAALEAVVRARSESLIDNALVQREVALRIVQLARSREPWLLDTMRAEFHDALGVMGSPLLLLQFELSYVDSLLHAGQLERAEAALVACQALAGAGGPVAEARLTLAWARLRRDEGRLQEAMRLYEVAIRLCHDTPGADLYLLEALLDRGALAADLGRWSAASADLELAAERATAIQNDGRMVAAGLQLAAMHCRRGDARRASGRTNQVRAALQGRRSQLVAVYHRVVGDVHRLEGGYEQAAQHYRQASDEWLRFDEPEKAATALLAEAGVMGRQGEWRATAALTASAAKVRRRRARLAGYRRTEPVVRADEDDARGLRHLLAGAGRDEAELVAARDWFFAAAQRLPAGDQRRAWYRLNLAFAHRLLHQQREAVEALEDVVRVGAGWTTSTVLHRLLARWGEAHGRMLLRDLDVEQADRRLRATHDLVRSRLPPADLVRLGIARADVLLAAGRETEAAGELQSVIAQAEAAGEPGAEAAARLRVALLVTTSLAQRIAHVMACLGLGGDANDSLVCDVVEALLDLPLPGTAYRRLFQAFQMLAAITTSARPRARLDAGARRLASVVGGQLSEPRPDVRPIVLTVDPSLLEAAASGARITAGEQPGDVAQRVERALGVPIPQAVLRPDSDLVAAAYAIEVTGTIVARGHVRTGGVFCVRPPPGPAGDGAWPVRDPVTGDRGAWLRSAPAAGAGSECWDAHAYMLRHMEAVIRQHASVFVTVDRAAEQLEAWRAAGALPASLAAADGPALVAGVMRGLLAEQVPIADVEAIRRSFLAAPGPDGDVQTAVERARLELAPHLPGADGSRQLIDLPAALERALGRHVREVDGRRYLAMAPAEAEQRRRELLRLLAGRQGGRLAVRVRDHGLRSLVRRFTESVAPDLAVVSEVERRRAQQGRGA